MLTEPLVFTEQRSGDNPVNQAVPLPAVPKWLSVWEGKDPASQACLTGGIDPLNC